MKFLKFFNEIPEENLSSIDEKVFVLYDSHGWICSDCTTACKSYKTALRRFFKVLTENNETVLSGWYAEILESCENGYFQMSDTESGFHWGVEEVSEGVWYVYLNIDRVIHDESYVSEAEEEATTEPCETHVFSPSFIESETMREIIIEDSS